MTTPEGFCPICQHNIEENNWKLPCGHEYHKFCIRGLYEMTLNRRCDMTFRRLKPKCPLCRYHINKKDLPSPHVLNLELREQPSISSMPVEERPYRMARATRIIERAAVRRLLDRLMDTRRKFISRRQQADLQPRAEPGPRAGPSGLCNTRAIDENESSDEPSQASRRGRLVMCSSSSSSQGSEPLKQICVTPNRLSQASARSRSPLSQTIVRLSPELQTDGMYGFNDCPDTIANLPRLQQDRIFQGLQREIGILEFQVETLNELPPRDVDPELIVISDDEESCDEDEEYDPRLLPVEVETRFGTGRGRYTKYMVKWSDGSRTINGTKDVEKCKIGKELLEKWRLKNRARNTANCRQRKKAAAGATNSPA